MYEEPHGWAVLLESMLDTLPRIGSWMDDVCEAFAGLGDADSSVSDENYVRATLLGRDRS